MIAAADVVVVVAAAVAVVAPAVVEDSKVAALVALFVDHPGSDRHWLVAETCTIVAFFANTLASFQAKHLESLACSEQVAFDIGRKD